MDMKPVYDKNLELYFPANEPRARKCYDGIQKYMGDMDFLIGLIPGKRRMGGTVVQAGGHIGLWPLKLARYFGKVITFEPDPPVFQALAMNVGDVLNIEAFPLALGAEASVKNFSHYSGRSAVSTIAEIKDEGDLHTNVRVTTVDNMRIKHLAALILDVEGYEPQALEGARSTIYRCHPVIQCELLPKYKAAIEAKLGGMGYARHPNPAHVKDRDGVFVWRS